jgi:hypothetical protein
MEKLTRSVYHLDETPWTGAVEEWQPSERLYPDTANDVAECPDFVWPGLIKVPSDRFSLPDEETARRIENACAWTYPNPYFPSKETVELITRHFTTPQPDAVTD